MKLKRFVRTSIIVISTLSIATASYAGLFSQPPKQRTALPQHNIKLVHTASNSHQRLPIPLPTPGVKATKNKPIIIYASYNKTLPTPELRETLPKPSVKTKRHHHHQRHAKPRKQESTFFVKSKRPANQHKNEVHDYQVAHLTRVAPFKGISANGNIFVNVKSGRFQEIKIMNTNFPGYKLVEPSVIKGVLVLRDISKKNLKELAPQLVMVNVTTPGLTSIKLRDNARIRAKNLRTQLLDIDAATTGFVNLRGNIGLHHVHQRGLGPINIEWANSDHIKIVSRTRGPIHIAGNTDHLTIRADDKADVDTKHLRSHTGMIQTAGKATVAVTVIDALSGFASELSNIFYYKTPKHLTRHTYDLGNVMQLRYWN